MNFEMKQNKCSSNEVSRCQSFELCQNGTAVSAKDLAKAGFYYDENECKCCTCGKVYNDWKVGDDPLSVHHQLSPDCSYIKAVKGNLVEKHKKESQQTVMTPRFTSSRVEVDEGPVLFSAPVQSTNTVLLTEVGQSANEETNLADTMEIVPRKNDNDQRIAIRKELDSHSNVIYCSNQLDIARKRNNSIGVPSLLENLVEMSLKRHNAEIVLSEEAFKFSFSVTPGFDMMESDLFFNFGLTTMYNLSVDLLFDAPNSKRETRFFDMLKSCKYFLKFVNNESNEKVYQHLLHYNTCKFPSTIFPSTTCITYPLSVKEIYSERTESEEVTENQEILFDHEEIPTEEFRNYYSHTEMGHQVCHPMDEASVNSSFDVLHVTVSQTTNAGMHDQLSLRHPDVGQNETVHETLSFHPSILSHLNRESGGNLEPYTSSRLGQPICHPSDDHEDPQTSDINLQMDMNVQLPHVPPVSRDTPLNETLAFPTTSETIQDNNAHIKSVESSDHHDRVLPSHRMEHLLLDGPILMANNSDSYQDTCTIDSGLTILMNQMRVNPDLIPIFKRSHHSIFSRELPALYELFMDRKYEELRQKWGYIIQHKTNNFHGPDGKFMMKPFDRLLNFHYSYRCNLNDGCSSNKTEYSCPQMILNCRNSADDNFDTTYLQGLIDRFTREFRPCREMHINTDRESCPGKCCITREVHHFNQPPGVVLNMVRSHFTRDQIGDLNRTVRIGAIEYYIGGLSFFSPDHYTARILLPQRNQNFFYDNLQGIQVMGLSALEPYGAILSLVYLFQK